MKLKLSTAILLLVLASGSQVHSAVASNDSKSAETTSNGKTENASGGEQQSALETENKISTETPTVDSAPTKRFGVYLGIGNPFPTLFGLNGAINVTKDLRASVGYGEVEVSTLGSSVKATTYAAGADYLFLPTAVRGVVGLRAGYFSVEGDGTLTIDEFDHSTGYAYSNLGMEWTGDSGYHFAIGGNFAFAGANGGGFYLNTGYFF